MAHNTEHNKSFNFQQIDTQSNTDLYAKSIKFAKNLSQAVIFKYMSIIFN